MRVLVLLLVLSGSAFCITLKNHQAQNSGSTGVSSISTSGYTVTAGDFIIVGCGASNATQYSTISDTLSNTWTSLGQTNDYYSTGTGNAWYTHSSSGGGDTITCSNGSGTPPSMQLAVLEFSGVNSFDVSNGWSAPSETQNCTAATSTTNYANDALAAFDFISRSGGTFPGYSVSSGYTIVDSHSSPYNALDAYQILTSTGAQSVTMGYSTNAEGGHHVCILAAFQPITVTTHHNSVYSY